MKTLSSAQGTKQANKPENITVTPYKALVHCLFEHRMQFWSPHSRQNTLIKVQEAVQVIKGMEQGAASV